ncbi:MipA/OmpV family protein [Neptunicella sp.]|uniref:MipA/OmpV family protein n=1 Tax=Neptunicella sp. TaxID=2125986 RepID=UPI003F6918F6
MRLIKWVAAILGSGLLLSSISIPACEVSQQHCIEQNSWRLGVALGAGVTINPLHDGDNIPLVILPDIAWYGESAYFDNGELGYQWVQSNHYAFETFLAINTEKAYFSFWHPNNLLLFNNNQLSAIFSPSQQPQNRISVNQVSERDWAVDLGVRAHWFTPSGEWRIAVLTDGTNTYNGQQLDLSYRHAWQINQWTLSVSPQLTWKSHQLLNYYYGLSQQDNVSDEQLYQAGSGWFPAITLLARKPISERWSWLIRGRYQHLPSAMSDSPLVARNNVVSGFIGAAYQF